MVKNEILILEEIIACTTNTLTAEEAYNVFKFKKIIRETIEQVKKDRVEIIKSVFGENFKESLEEMESLKRNKDFSNPKFKDLKEKEEKFTNMLNKLLSEEIDTSDIKPMSYASWHEFQKENFFKNENQVKNPLGGIVELLLENVLWK